ncbi:glycosyltransferase family 2 protein [Bacillus timonensis]|nr:glycosyltransferase family 2 protein [Bacillus timonensis]
MPAPVIIFVYNREEHVKKCLEALGKNRLANETKIYIFSDGPKNEKDKAKVESVRKYLNTIKNSKLFKSISIISSAENKGLANSVIEGVTKIINKYGRVIVVEDDAIASINFLEYMNSCLDSYQQNKQIGAIGGFTIPIVFPDNFKNDVFLVNRGSSYAWATWVDRWMKVDWEVKDYKYFKYNLFKRKAFDKYASGRSAMLDNQMTGIIDSWAIRFSYAMHKNKLLWVMPKISKIQTIGFDGSGTHCSTETIYENVKLDSGERNLVYDNASFDKRIAQEYGRHFKSPYDSLKKIYYFIKRELLNS